MGACYAVPHALSIWIGSGHARAGPGALPRTSTIALTNATLPYALRLANRGLRDALRADPGFLAGLNCYDGQITCPPVAESLGLPCVDPAKVL